ncbi:AraC-like DNA-binding protein [Lipingzhangella halophila]|uniref:AraC-like DNA-binding protein n=1 Tax=Lipingzhangella halophila TaxID=1783352 RepID=A0A7W7RNP9_9ACTN|nr:AraC family transcriptional regulator [Lipingzhangella halophila]MBB4935372.1 AraC-like DNA-binding protein [Lipingzhangella halophila]
MVDGTVSTHLARLVRDVALTLGVQSEEVARLAGLDDRTLDDDLNRVPMATLGRLWELLAWAAPGAGAGLRVAEAARLGCLSTWDYLVTNGSTLSEAFRESVPYHWVVTDVSEQFEVVDDSGPLTVRYQSMVDENEAAAAIHEYVLAYYLERARQATGQHITPTGVTFAHEAPRRHRSLADAFGTDRIEFGSPANTITFPAADAQAPLPRADTHLATLLRSHADLLLTASRAVPQWHDQFREMLSTAVAQDTVSLDTVAARLATSPRTLQRRLAEHGTNWQDEVDAVRYEQAQRMLRDDGLTVGAIAARLGFTDDRALRKAFQRWSGTSPASFRRALQT